jgi:voltage-gated potassium channel
VVVQDLISPGAGLDLLERAASPQEHGKSLAELSELVVGVVRDGKLHLYNDPEVAPLRAGDRLITVQAMSPDDIPHEDAPAEVHGGL